MFIMESDNPKDFEPMSSFPVILSDCLWHCTTPSRYELILKSGAILPEPEIPDKSRWNTAQGPKHYPFVRSLGGVSLFDFTDFDADKYSESYIASWHTFVPLHEWGGYPVWIEVDRNLVQDSLIGGNELVKKWENDKAYGHNIMPFIEVAHIGPLNMSAFARVLHFTNGSWIQIR